MTDTTPSSRTTASKPGRSWLLRTSRRSTARTTSTRDVSILAALVEETKNKIEWNRILQPTTLQWNWLENCGAFAIYTCHATKETTASTFSVLASGVVTGSLPEVVSLLVAHSHIEYEHQMKALHGKAFKKAAYMGDVTREDELDHVAQAAVTAADHTAGSAATTLSVRTATFATSKWSLHEDEWHHVETTCLDSGAHRFEKYLATLTPPQGTFSHKNHHLKPRRGSSSECIGGYQVVDEQVDDVAASVRVHFFGEMAMPPSMEATSTPAKFPWKWPRSSEPSSVKTTKHRLLQLAKSCDRLSVLIRRRRLGLQVLVDQRRVLPPLHPVCFSCGKSHLMVGKICRLCGHSVCAQCSKKYERDSQGDSSDGGIQVEWIRVCSPCLARVESADYSLSFSPRVPLTRATGTTAVVEVADPVEPSDLKTLLRDALLDAPTSRRKASVMSVIRCVLDQEQQQTENLLPCCSSMELNKKKMTRAPLTRHSSSSHEYVEALDDLDFVLATTPLVHREDLLASSQGRGYLINTRGSLLSAPQPYPVPSYEPQRLHAMAQVGLLDYGTHTGGTNSGPWQELTIICEIAAKELNVFACLVTVITQTEQFVVASNVPELANMRMPREQSFCQHTVMDSKPLVVRHPEADLRFSRIAPVVEMGLRYYCGFPLEDSHQNVIGTLCAIDKKTHELTESQFTVMVRLAQTAAKVVRIQGRQRRCNSGVAAPPIG